MKVSQKDLFQALIWVIMVFFILASCTPVKNNCGTTKQHKIRMNNTKKMAPSMMN